MFRRWKEDPQTLRYTSNWHDRLSFIVGHCGCDWLHGTMAFECAERAGADGRGASDRKSGEDSVGLMVVFWPAPL
jgi:hypothetical protein